MIARALAAALVLAGTASAAPWKAPRGTLEAGRLEGSFLLSSDAAPGRYSEASMITTDAVTLPYSLSATWRRLGPEAGRSMHVLVAGGVVLVKSGAIAFYAYDDTAFAQGAWRPLAGHLAQAEHAIAVHQDHHTIVVSIDGAEVARYALEVARESAFVGFGMKSAPGLRSAIYVRGIALAHSPQ